MRVGHLKVAGLAAQLLDGSDGALHHLRIGARVAEGHGSSVRGDRMAAVDGDVAVGDEWSALAIAAESESLQLADDFEGERVIELQHVHVVAPQSGVAERTLGRPSADNTINVLAPAPDEVPRRWVLVRR